jgi:cytochrome c556
MRLLVLFLLAGAALAQAPSTPAPAPQPPFLKSVGTMSEIMIDIVFPTSNEVFYVNRNPDKSEKDWEDLRNNALVLAESANLLMAENRAKDKDRWMKDAQLLWEVGNKAFKAAKAKDLEGLKALNDDLYEACQSCHEHYRPGYRRRL